MMTKRDPHGNIVRGTIAALAAAVGGADAVTVLPFSAALGIPDAFARRVARNTQTHPHRGGQSSPRRRSGRRLGRHRGPDRSALPRRLGPVPGHRARGRRCRGARSRIDPAEVATVRAEREANVARRKDALVGTSDFPDLAEDKVPILGTPRLSIINSDEAALPRHRVAESFERLRDRSDDYLTRRGSRPKVFLACLGRAADFNARASFAKSLFRGWRHRSGGRKRRQPRETIPRIPARSSPASAPLTRSMRARRSTPPRRSPPPAPSTFILPASPAPTAPRLEGAGIGSFLHQGCDTLQVLNAAYDEI